MTDLQSYLSTITPFVVIFLLWKYFLYIRIDSICHLVNRKYMGLQLMMELSEQGWAVSVRTEDGWKIQKTNQKFCDILGYDWSDETDNELIDVVGYALATPESIDTFTSAYNKNMMISTYITKLKKKDGKEIWVEISAQTVVFSDVGEKRISVIKNIEHIISKFKE